MKKKLTKQETSASNLTIHEWDRKERKVAFLGYNRDHTACLIRNEKNEFQNTPGITERYNAIGRV